MMIAASTLTAVVTPMIVKKGVDKSLPFCYNNYRKKEVFIMEKVKIDFGKSYERQSKKAKSMLCKRDFYEIKNLLIFKNNLKKELTNK